MKKLLLTACCAFVLAVSAAWGQAPEKIDF